MSRVTEAQTTRQKPRSKDHLAAKPDGEHDFEQIQLQMRAGTGDTHGTLENVAFERNENRPQAGAKPRLAARVPHTRGQR